MLSLSTCENSLFQKNSVIQIHDYRIDKDQLLGSGAFAKAYKGWDKNNNQICVKAIQKSERKKQILRMAKQQALILESLQHTSINRFITTFESQHHFYIVTQYYEGQNLGEYMKNNKNKAAKQAYQITKELLQILEYLHSKKIMHRDLKPQNIIKTKSKLVLIDFGFSCKLPKGDFSVLNDIVGTPSYMAPQLLENKKYTSKADIWSLGVLIYQLTNGRLPWAGKSQNQLLQKIKTQKLSFQNSKINPILKLMIKKCLQLCPDKRISWRELFVFFNCPRSYPLYQMDLIEQESGYCSCNFFQ